MESKNGKYSGQGGRTTAKMHAALSEVGEEEEETPEDRINRIMESRKLLGNASYFAFTATPKNKTLELFGEKQADGSYRPTVGCTYTMKQAIEEGFILDVLNGYSWSAVEQFVELFLGGAERDQLDPILDACVATYIVASDELRSSETASEHAGNSIACSRVSKTNAKHDTAPLWKHPKTSWLKHVVNGKRRSKKPPRSELPLKPAVTTTAPIA